VHGGKLLEHFLQSLSWIDSKAKHIPERFSSTGFTCSFLPSTGFAAFDDQGGAELGLPQANLKWHSSHIARSRDSSQILFECKEC